MLSFTTGRNLYGKLTKNTTSTNLTDGDLFISDTLRKILAMTDWWWAETSDTVATVATQQAYQIPKTIRKVSDVYVTVGTTIYTPKKIYDPEQWSGILQRQLGSSDVALFAYIRGKQLLLAPTPSSINTITFVGRIGAVDLSIADYTTGTIVSIANAATTVTGSGTTWNASMKGRYIRIDDSEAANVGDNVWYEIASVTSTTVLELVKPYEGTAIAAGSPTYAIGQMSPLPEEYELAPIYRATALYWDSQGDHNRADTYWQLYDGGKEKGKVKLAGGIIGSMTEDNSTFEGVMIPRSSDTSIDINNYPRDLTGF